MKRDSYIIVSILFGCIFLRALFDFPVLFGVLDEYEIGNLYQQFVAVNFSSQEKYRYVPFPVHRNTKKWRWDGKDFPRVIALLEFDRFVSEHTIRSEKSLLFNGDDPECEYISIRQKKIINYHDDPVHYDLQRLELDEHDFDFVMLNQTLEHVYDPIRCLENVARVMKPGGIVYLNVPVLNIPHDTPFHHYTGFTPTGLGALLKAAGFTILSIGQWGNRFYVKKLFESLSWPDYRSLLLETQDIGLNEFEYPVVAWIFAQKPLGDGK